MAEQEFCTLEFNSNNGKFFIRWAQFENTKYERTHMTQLSTSDLEKYKEKGLDFHYELHFADEIKFIRFDCNCYPYKTYRQSTKSEFFEKLSRNKHEELYEIRTKLKKEFKKVFSNSPYKLSRNQYNYVYLLRYDFNASNYNDAIKESEKFINNTYDKMLEIIKSVM